MARKQRKRRRKTGQTQKYSYLPQQPRKTQPRKNNDSYWTPGLLTGLGAAVLWPFGGIGAMAGGFGMKAFAPDDKMTTSFGSGLMWGSGIGLIAVPVGAYFLFRNLFEGLFSAVMPKTSAGPPTIGMTDEEMYPWR